MFVFHCKRPECGCDSSERIQADICSGLTGQQVNAYSNMQMHSPSISSSHLSGATCTHPTQAVFFRTGPLFPLKHVHVDDMITQKLSLCTLWWWVSIAQRSALHLPHLLHFLSMIHRLPLSWTPGTLQMHFSLQRGGKVDGWFCEEDVNDEWIVHNFPYKPPRLITLLPLHVGNTSYFIAVHVSITEMILAVQNVNPLL